PRLIVASVLTLAFIVCAYLTFMLNKTYLPALEAGASKILIPMTSATDISHPPHNPKGRFSLSVRSSREATFSR
ncbi:hypothetical protein, partial [Vibrio parahaemolyticus]|uniref:hypothetical protein n=1 Tax=Vibrio parahaemolyticus TaxID=670 RepID=UPI001C610E4D